MRQGAPPVVIAEGVHALHNRFGRYGKEAKEPYLPSAEVLVILSSHGERMARKELGGLGKRGPHEARYHSI